MEKTLGQNHFDPLLCFARHPHQTPDEVYDIIQDRMMTLLSYVSSRSENVKLEELTTKKNLNAALDAIKRWETYGVILDTETFENIGSVFGVKMADVLGTPKITDEDKRIIEEHFKDIEKSSLDPVPAFVIISAFERINEIAMERLQIMIQDHNNVR